MPDNARDPLTPTVPKVNRRSLNAVKHGAFSTLSVLPGEDFDEFKELCDTRSGPSSLSRSDHIRVRR